MTKNKEFTSYDVAMISDWAEVRGVMDEMTWFEKRTFLRARIGSPRLDKMDRDEYDGVIGDWLLNEWPELPLTENVGT